MANLELAFSDLYQKVAENWGIVDIGTAPTGTNLTTCKNMVYRGYRNFLYPVDMRNGKRHIWSFLKQYYGMNTSGDIWRYALPADFGRIIVDPMFEKSTGYPALKKVDASYIIQERVWSDRTGYPEVYAIVPSRYDITTGTSWDLWLYPTPDSAYLLWLFYVIHPKKPENDTDILAGGVESAEAILESCLAIVESQEDEMATSHHTKAAANLIQQLIVADDVDKADILGRMTLPELRGFPKPRGMTEIDDANIYA